MAERRIGVIPHCMTIMRSGQMEQCAVLVTDRRTIIAFEEARVVGLGASMRKSFEDPDKELAEIEQQTDFATVDLDWLASVNENISVPHTAVEKLQIKKTVGGYSLSIEYRSEEGKKLFTMADFTPSKELMAKRKGEGVAKKEARRMYAERAQEVFKRALPPVAAGKAEWLE